MNANEIEITSSQQSSIDIFTPTTYAIKWNVDNGSSVRTGQLIATISSASNSIASVSSDKKASKIIRARRIKRNIKPIKTDQNGTTETAYKSNLDKDKESNTNTSSSSSNFLGSLLKKSQAANEKVKDSLSKSTKGEKAEASSKVSSVVVSSSNGTSKDKGMIEIRAHLDGLVTIYSIPEQRELQDKKMMVCGKIEPCDHPAIVHGLCAICGQTVSSTNPSQSTQNSDKDADKKRNNLILSGGVSVSISSEYSKTITNDKSTSLRSSQKLNLVLDLDHTLLHATADRRAQEYTLTQTDVRTLLLPLMEGHPLAHLQNTQTHQPHYVKLRPHLADFLWSLKDQYEISIYTAGTRMYAEKIADLISRHVVDHQIGREKVGDGQGCLDEDQLLMLRQNVDRLKERVAWYNAKKERKQYVQDMIAKAEKDAKREEEMQEDIPHMLAGSEMEEEEVKEPAKKRQKRVSFAATVENDDGSKEEMSKETRVEKEAKKAASEEEDEDPNEELKVLEEKLNQAEKLESRVQSVRAKIFGSRIISRTDVGDNGQNVKSIKRMFPCGGQLAAIVDDREDVWANSSENFDGGRKGEPPDNLLFCRPYHWKAFQNFADVNNASGEDITLQTDGNKEDDEVMNETHEMQLVWTKNILEGVHSRYYSKSISEEHRNKLSVPGILRKMRREVFGNMKPPANVVLSGLVPLHKQNSNDMNRPRPHIIRYTEALGAKISNDINNDITHCIAARDGTDKVLRARKVQGCYIVKVSWLMECYWSISLRSVDEHLIGPKPPQTKEAPKILLEGSDSSEDEDDDFFDDLEKDFES
ncbi:hypothetical protein CTEN210_16311 [Chaetoceros tenuissimus]|uniref:protein-serine/threonine phosphatase n=1 Tax=Chaetoceros tenuissimus TaxID=426638 RepID=A0AAD3DAK8_9STRA|nr:hypothetical protein CTEN210_16311 [Chaetoceros tenuissimus]